MTSAHHVMVIDDDVDVREGLMDFLEDNGYQPVGAVHGQEALQKLGGSNVRPCVILLDLMMPVMDGRSFREQQLQLPELSAIPVLIVSASKEAEQTAKDLHTAGHLTKPLNLKELLRIVRGYCMPD